VNGLPLGLVRWWERIRYDRYWRSRPGNWSYGINVIDQAVATGSYRKILDAGCGKGDVVAHLLNRGYEACGVELSAHAVTHGVVRTGEVMQGSLDKLPFSDRRFDLVFSSEVLEHISAERIPAVARELVRVCRTRLFLTISLRPSSQNNMFHVTLRPRDWWEEQFLQTGVRPNRQLVDCWQHRGPYSNREVLERGPAAAIINEMKGFIADEPYSFCGELEPWYFVFDR
jgi:SAM-dependent methyltransferase